MPLAEGGGDGGEVRSPDARRSRAGEGDEVEGMGWNVVDT